MKLENVTLDMLGTAKKVLIKKDDTTIVDGGGEKPEIESRVAQIRQQIEDTTSDYDKERAAGTRGQAGRRCLPSSASAAMTEKKKIDRSEGAQGPRR